MDTRQLNIINNSFLLIREVRRQDKSSSLIHTHPKHSLVNTADHSSVTQLKLQHFTQIRAVPEQLGLIIMFSETETSARIVLFSGHL